MASTGSSSSAPIERSSAADYVVAVPAFNQARTIQSVIRAAHAVVDSGFLGLRGRTIVTDSGSTDDTFAAARAAAASAADTVVLPVPVQGSASTSLPYHGVPGRARALRLALEAARDAGARAVVVIDATAPNTEERITRLLRSVLTESYDFAAPVYRGRPFDAILVKSIIRPMFRTCFGLQLRHPLGPELACSGGVVDHVLQSRTWPPDVADAGIDLWLATTATAESFAVCEVALLARAASREDSPDLAETVAQVVGALFREIDRRAATWQRVRASQRVSTFDSLPAPPAPPGEVDVRRPLDAFRLGCRELSDLWADILPPATILELRRLAAVPDASFRMADRFWARIVADFAVGYRHRVIARDHLLRALAPLYLGWVGSLMLECGTASADAVEARIDRLGENFELEKAYLISRWRWPERFRPR
jgi:glucosylglycerate synthase